MTYACFEAEMTVAADVELKANLTTLLDYVRTVWTCPFHKIGARIQHHSYFFIFFF